jgi:hypothetical protein
MHLPAPLFDPETSLGDKEDRIRSYCLRKPSPQMEMFLEEFPDPRKPLVSYYRDQAPDFGFGFACYTVWGIQEIDSAFAALITRGRGHYTVEQMEALILANPHLHPVIKTNLLHNARTCLSGGG